ncbi:hypothetical protein [Pseudomonas sp. AS2.8]|uniref:hypothetical protein n=1 Tax=Pseudomonas sp. AS2.8 TaxID=2587128 RepID=UPI00161136EF|nr:hypothetical protein [Pseudomonas sp. AS2.8]MBB2895088.1 hypothetical protein [Pseudomonas sp. AS2.8]
MNVNWKNCCNSTSGSSRISDIKSYIKESTPTQASAIDNFYGARTNIIQAATPNILNTHPWLSSFLVASTVSATEDYFREISSFCLSNCSLSKANSSEKSIHLGSAIWNSVSFFSRGCFEHLSFASQETIKKCSKDYLGHEIDKKSNTAAALIEYEKICELRHGIVHSNSLLPGKNAIKLGLGNLKNPTSVIKIEPGVAEVHESIAICSSVVENYNQELFQEMCKRWATSWRSDPGWDPSNASSRFKSLYDGFFSETHKAHQHTWRKVLNFVKSEYGV